MFKVDASNVLVFGFALCASCSQSNTHDVNLVCHAMSFDEGGPKDSNDMVGISIRNDNVIFSGATHFDLPASRWKAKMCYQSRFSNERLVHFDNVGCSEDLSKVPPTKERQIVGSYDYLTKVLAILGTGNFVCSEAK